MKKLWTSLLFATMSAGLLAGCATGTNTAARVFDSKSEVYGFETVSAISLLHDVKFADDSSLTDSSESSSETPSSEEPTSEEPSSSETSSETTSEDTSSEETPVEETVDIAKYLGIMEQLLSDSPIQMVTEASDLAEYTTKMTITTTDLNDLTSTFVLYYNEVVEETPVDSSEESSEATTEESSEATTEESSETTPSISERHGDHHEGDGDGYFGDSGEHGDHHGDDDEDSEDESETSEPEGETEENEYRDHHEHEYGDSDDGDETTLEGIVIVNDVTYDLVGEKDEDELSFFVSIDENNWIKVAQEVNDSEEKYKYTIMADGVKTKMSFKIESDEEGTKVTLKETIGADVYSYKFYKTTDDSGNEVIYIIAFEDGIVTHIKVTATIDETTGETTYTYVTLESGHTHEDHGNHGYHDGGRHGHGGR